MTIAKKPAGRGLYLSRSFRNSFDAAKKKEGTYTQEGAASSIQERKAENEECF